MTNEIAQRTLDVYFHGKLCGHLSENYAGAAEFQYSPEYLAQGSVPPLSVSLPLQEVKFPASISSAYFSGLLPDEDMREAIARVFGVSKGNTVSILEAVGGECAGAVSVVPSGSSFIELTDDQDTCLNMSELDDLFVTLTPRPLLAGKDGIRLSLAGAQKKLAVRIVGKQVYVVRGGKPTTHIIKPPIKYVPNSVENEFFCMRLAAACQIPTAEVELMHTETQAFLAVKRFDRIEFSSGINRLHQEDFCQALAIAPERKYEREGGPNVAQCLQLLARSSAQPAKDQIIFRRLLAFNYLIGNNDAHGKNYSLLYSGATPSLAPAYDLLSTALYPDLDEKMAMKIGGKYVFHEVLQRHWLSLVPEAATSQASMRKELQNIAQQCREQSRLLIKQFEALGIRSECFAGIIEIIEKRSDRLLRLI
jgi:serine/threonine-protein kinase HipA